MTDTKTTAVVLSKGAHSPNGEYCVMEHISVRAKLPWSDRPNCTHPVIASMARAVNDRLDDKPRQELLQLEDDLMACPPRPDLEPRLSVTLAIWCAEQVLPIWEARYPEDQRPGKAIEAAKTWLIADAAAAAGAAYAYAGAAAAPVSVAPTPKLIDLLKDLIGQYREIVGAATAKRSEPAAGAQS